MLAARRRLLGMLLVLALGSGALAVTKMAAWWVVVPPFVMLLGLRGPAAARGRQGRRRTRAGTAAPRHRGPPHRPPPTGRCRGRRGGCGRACRPAAPLPRCAPVPDAEVIDISASLGEGGEEFYDQYADAKLRAVGDLARPRRPLNR